MESMGIKFGDQLLLMPDGEHQLQQWLEFALPIEDLNLFAWHSPSQVDTRSNPRSSLKSRVGLPTPNWPAPPEVTINSLYVPTGATRWAVGLYLADSEILAKVRENLDDNGKGTLELGTRDGSPASLQMYLLTPRRISAPSNAVIDQDLWLLPLVDARYFWQFKNAGDYEVTWASGSWASLYAEAANDIEGSAPDATDYFQPDPIELTRPYENSAVLLDAIAASLGKRITLSSDGELLFLDRTESYSLLKGNLEVDDGGTRQPDTSWDLLAGGWGLHDRVPLRVDVVFQKYVKGNGVSDNERWLKSIETNLLAFNGAMAGVIKTIFTTAAANFTDGGGTPSNDSDVDALAEVIARDYIDWLRGNFSHFDVTFHGIRPWTQTGFDDYVLYRYGCQLHSYRDEMLTDIGFFAHENAGDYVCYTRACSLPFNFGTSEQLQQILDAREPFGRYQGILLADFIAGDSTVDCDHVQPIDGSPSCLVDPTDDEEAVELNNVTGFAGTLGNLVIFRWNRYTKQFEIEDTPCPTEE